MHSLVKEKDFNIFSKISNVTTTANKLNSFLRVRGNSSPEKTDQRIKISFEILLSPQCRRILAEGPSGISPRNVWPPF